MSFPTGTSPSLPYLETPIGAVYAALTARLTGYSALWGDQVYTRFAPVRAALPYVVSWRVGGGLLPGLRSVHELVVASVVYAATFAQANQGALALSTALRDSGNQDRRTAFGVLKGWSIVTVTEGQSLEDAETRSDGVQVFWNGSEFTWRLERS